MNECGKQVANDSDRESDRESDSEGGKSMIDNQKERRWREADCVFKHWPKASHSSEWTA